MSTLSEYSWCFCTRCTVAGLIVNATVKQILKDERKYYEDMLKYSREHLMLYPYHLSDVVVKGLRVTPFSYYTSMMAEIMTQEKSYDSLPNFTAADCMSIVCQLSYLLFSCDVVAVYCVFLSFLSQNSHMQLPFDNFFETPFK